MKKKLVIIIMFLFCVGCSTDPEFLNCYVEIITATDTLRLDGAFVEFEGKTIDSPSEWIVDGINDNVLIMKGNGEWNFREKDIIKMTIIYEAPPKEPQ